MQCNQAHNRPRRRQIDHIVDHLPPYLACTCVHACMAPVHETRRTYVSRRRSNEELTRPAAGREGSSILPWSASGSSGRESRGATERWLGLFCRLQFRSEPESRDVGRCIVIAWSKVNRRPPFSLDARNPSPSIGTTFIIRYVLPVETRPNHSIIC